MMQICGDVREDWVVQIYPKTHYSFLVDTILLLILDCHQRVMHGGIKESSERDFGLSKGTMW